ncbi:uncharacterized protein METZ01_LOCUS260879, partial [marine metagenome]
GSGGGRSLYLTVDCDQTDDQYASFYFDYSEPQFPGTSDTRPLENAADNEYGQSNIQYRHAFDSGVGRTSYFHGIMDETGSFQVFSARQNEGYSNYPFSVGIHRVETPRSPDVDPFPVWIFCKWFDNQNYHGAWSGFNLFDWHHHYYSDRNGPAWDSHISYAGRGGNAMWTAAGAYSANGMGTSLCFPGWSAYSYEGFTIGYGYTFATPGTRGGPLNLNGDDLDGSWPLIPGFVINGCDYYSTYKSVRGRVADLRMGCGGYGWAYDPSGFTIPVSGTITGCQVGAIMFPATEAWLPGS